MKMYAGLTNRVRNLTSREIDIKAHKTSAILVYPCCLFLFFRCGLDIDAKDGRRRKKPTQLTR